MLAGIVLAVIMTCSVAHAGLEAGWWSLTTGVEHTWHADDDPWLFRQAEGTAASAYLSTGLGMRWLAACGFTDQRLWQETWNYRGLKGSLWLRRALSPAWSLETQAYLTAETMEIDEYLGLPTAEDRGWSLGIGGAWVADPDASLRETIGFRLARRSFTGEHGLDAKVWAGEVNLEQQTLAGRLRLALLADRLEGRMNAALLVRAERSIGKLQINATVLGGRQDAWFDVERLVIHDGTVALQGLASVGAQVPLGGGWSLRPSVGWEKNVGAESRWGFLGLNWSRTTWKITK